MTPHAAASLIFAALLSGAAALPASAAAPKHVILIMMENHGTDTLLGNKEDAPFLNALIAEKGVRYATQYYGVTHPSLPNYLALAAGDEMGIHDDCKAGADVKCKPEEFTPDAEEAPMAGHMLTDEEEKRASDTAHLFAGKTLIDQLDEAKVSWKVYMQGLPADRQIDGILAARRLGQSRRQALRAEAQSLRLLFALRRRSCAYGQAAARGQIRAGPDVEPARFGKVLP